jgi:hypothetical protein
MGQDQDGLGPVDLGMYTTYPHPYMSFVIRCWEHTSGEVWGRMVDTHSGRQYPLTDIREVPELIEHIFHETGEGFEE